MPKGKIAYFSPEFALSDELPIFAGGLGVLAADILYQARDLDLPLVGVTLLYLAGCSHQRVDEEGNVKEECIKLNPQEAGLSETGVVVEVPFPDRKVYLKVWKKEIEGVNLYLLDTDLPKNSEADRTLAYRLYDGRDWPPHIERDALLGIGGVRALRKLGEEISVWHLNDDHTSFCLLERIRERVRGGDNFEEACQRTGEETVFTTHTIDPGAESIFTFGEITPYFNTLFAGLSVSPDKLFELGARKVEGQKVFSATVFSMRCSGIVNAVSQAHQKASQKRWGFVWANAPEDKIPIAYITNAVYPPRWVADPIGALYDRYLSSDWRRITGDPSLWRKIAAAPDEAFWQARFLVKKRLADEVLQRTGKKIDPEALILSYARRLVEYKQPTLLISDLSRLASILCNSKYPAYLLVAGKIHPQDERGKEAVQALVKASFDPRLEGRLIFLEDYGLKLAQLLTSGSDVWLNTPLPGREACGTSGMKALYNGVLHASTLDGWWAEAYDGKNGWVIDGSAGSPQEGPDGVYAERSRSAASFYNLLEKEIVPLYYRKVAGVPKEWVGKVKNAIATIAPCCTTARMLKEYVNQLYRQKVDFASV